MRAAACGVRVQAGRFRLAGGGRSCEASALQVTGTGCKAGWRCLMPRGPTPRFRTHLWPSRPLCQAQKETEGCGEERGGCIGVGAQGERGPEALGLSLEAGLGKAPNSGPEPAHSPGSRRPRGPPRAWTLSAAPALPSPVEDAGAWPHPGLRLAPSWPGVRRPGGPAVDLKWPGGVLAAGIQASGHAGGDCGRGRAGNTPRKGGVRGPRVGAEQTIV